MSYAAGGALASLVEAGTLALPKLAKLAGMLKEKYALPSYPPLFHRCDTVLEGLLSRLQLAPLLYQPGRDEVLKRATQPAPGCVVASSAVAPSAVAPSAVASSMVASSRAKGEEGEVGLDGE